jgi:hypothetical protein
MLNVNKIELWFMLNLNEIELWFMRNLNKLVSGIVVS